MPWGVVEADTECPAESGASVRKLDADGNPTGDLVSCHETIADAQAEVDRLYEEEGSDRPEPEESPTAEARSRLSRSRARSAAALRTFRSRL